MVRVTTHLNHTYRVEALELEGGEVIPTSDWGPFMDRVTEAVYSGVFHSTQADGARLIIPGRDVRIVSSTPPRGG